MDEIDERVRSVFGMKEVCSVISENKLLYFRDGIPIAIYQMVGPGQVSEEILVPVENKEKE